MTNVLAAVDRSPYADPVFRTAIAFAALLHATPCAVHVREDGIGTLDRMARSLNLELAVVGGQPVDRIILASQAPDVAALVLGAGGRGTAAQPAGHTALEIIARARKPVVVVPAIADPRERFSRILVPLDGTAATSETLRQTFELAQASELEILALHVHTAENAPEFADHQPYATQAWENEFLARHVPIPHDRVTLIRRSGVPADDIVALAGERGVDLIVLAWNQSLRGDHARVVSQTIARSGVPVLLLPTFAARSGTRPSVTSAPA